MDERWIWAGIAVAAGLFVGVVAGVLIRRTLDQPQRRPALREIAAPLSLFAFWVLFAAGVLLAVGVSTPERLESIPTDLLEWLPNLAMAGLLLIGGYALGLALSAAIGRAHSRVSGRRNRGVEQVVRWAVVGGAAILALNQLGVDTTVINILIAGLAFATAGSMAGLSIVGGRHVATHIAAGRMLRRVLPIGSSIRVGDLDGVVQELQPAHLVLETEEGQMLVPYGSIVDEPVLLRGEGSPADVDR